MKPAIITLAFSGPMDANARASQEHAAWRWGCEHVVYTDRLTTGTNPYEEKLHLDARAKSYARVVYLDADVVIQRDCPSLFDLVPAGTFGAVPHAQEKYEPAKLAEERTLPVLWLTMKAAGITAWDWSRDYIDSGVMVFDPPKHGKVFEKARALRPGASSDWRVVDQGLISVALAATGATLHSLPPGYNARGWDAMAWQKRTAMCHPIYHYAGSDAKRFIWTAAWELPPGPPFEKPLPRNGRESWGAKMWREDIHLPALRWDGQNADAERARLAGLVERIQSCGGCRTEWETILRETPPDLASPEAYFRWTWAAHERVNAKAGKPGMTLEAARTHWTNYTPRPTAS